MEQLTAWLITARRPALLVLLAAAIAELTVRGRAHYDDPDVADQLRETNEAIHRIAGHLRDLCYPDEAMTASRTDAVAEQFKLLSPSTLSRLYELATKT